MANCLNYSDEYRTNVAKGNVPANALVKVNKLTSHNSDSVFGVIDEHGNEGEYTLQDVTSFGYLKHSKGTFDIVADYYRNGKDQYGNTGVLHGRIHITPNIRSSVEILRFGDDCLYSSRLGNGYSYEYRELTDQEVIDMIMEEIVYGVRPDLDSSSCVGTTKKGFDVEPNYHDGNYYLPNNKDYTVCWCRGTIKIREGKDGGWYSGVKSDAMGREIYQGQMDWERYRTAILRKSALFRLSNAKDVLEKYPEAIDLVVSKIRNEERFLLNSEIEG